MIKKDEKRDLHHTPKKLRMGKEENDQISKEELVGITKETITDTKGSEIPRGIINRQDRVATMGIGKEKGNNWRITPSTLGKGDNSRAKWCRRYERRGNDGRRENNQEADREVYDWNAVDCKLVGSGELGIPTYADAY